MELKPGYKQTEAGVIPEDWQVELVGSAFDICNSLRLPISEGVRKTMEGQYPYYGPTSIQGFINEYRVEGEFALVGEDGDHFLKWRNIPMTLLVTGKFNVNNHAHIVKGSKNLTSWFYYYFSHKDLTQYLTRQGAGRYKLTKNALVNIPCVLPPLPEQRAIAVALSDTDALLSSLDRLLAKKRDIKQAVMQQLLTGKQRLPGFRGDWETKRLGEISSIISGSSKSKYIKDAGRYLIVDMGAVSVEGKLIASKPTDYHGDFLKRGDLVMPKDDIGGGNIIGKAAYIDEDEQYILGDHVYALKIKLGNPLFLSHVINSKATNSALRKKVSGSAQLGLGRKSVEEQFVPFPPQAEQAAIAGVLLDMDAEIDALQERRDKTRALKQGMMQELLNGRTRLV